MHILRTPYSGEDKHYKGNQGFLLSFVDTTYSSVYSVSKLSNDAEPIKETNMTAYLFENKEALVTRIITREPSFLYELERGQHYCLDEQIAKKFNVAIKEFGDDDLVKLYGKDREQLFDRETGEYNIDRKQWHQEALERVVKKTEEVIYSLALLGTEDTNKLFPGYSPFEVREIAEEIVSYFTECGMSKSI
jgi:hypothetical protein